MALSERWLTQLSRLAPVAVAPVSGRRLSRLAPVAVAPVSGRRLGRPSRLRSLAVRLRLLGAPVARPSRPLVVRSSGRRLLRPSDRLGLARRSPAGRLLAGRSPTCGRDPGGLIGASGPRRAWICWSPGLMLAPCGRIPASRVSLRTSAA
jgi:hypothetical protein